MASICWSERNEMTLSFACDRPYSTTKMLALRERRPVLKADTQSCCHSRFPFLESTVHHGVRLIGMINYRFMVSVNGEKTLESHILDRLD